MSLFPPVQQIKLDDVPGAPRWFEEFLKLLNPVLRFLVTLAGASGLVGTHALLKTFEVRTDADYLTGDQPLVRFQTGLRSRINNVQVIQAIDLDDPDTPLSGPITCTGAWRVSAGEVRVYWVAGLRKSRRYQLTFWVW